MEKRKEPSCLEMLVWLAIWSCASYALYLFGDSIAEWKRLNDAKVLGLELRVANLEFQIYSNQKASTQP